MPDGADYVYSCHYQWAPANTANLLPIAAELSQQQDITMYPTTLTQLARANPFSAPLFSLQKIEEPQQSHGQRTRRLAAAATIDGNPADLLQFS